MKPNSLDNESDRQLIRGFAEGRDERAFATLVKRHGALVAGVCARMLRNRADAEDALQAVFMVLARRADALRRHASLAGWLHQVAVRVCLNERKTARRRQQRLREAAEVARETTSTTRLEELKQVIDEELAALPQKLREVVILCDLEGRTREAVARTLSLPTSTVTSRLTLGRECLRKRLLRHGLPIAVGDVAFALAKCSQAAPAVSSAAVQHTVRNAQAFLSGTEAAKSTLGIHIHALAEGALHAMLVSQWKTAMCFVALVATSLFGGAFAPRAIPLLTRPASAGTIFYDDFEDGDLTNGVPVTLTDGQPVTWHGELGAALQIQDGSLVVSGTSVPIAVPSIGSLDNVSIQVQMRVLQGDYAGLAGRRTLGGPHTGYFVAVGEYLNNGVRTNDAFLAYAGSLQILHAKDVNFDPKLEDVILQLDIIGNKVTYWAWPADEPRPAEPNGSVIDDTLSSGALYLWASSPGLSGNLNGRAAFRYVHVADTAIVPEPKSNALAGISGVILLVGAAARIRRSGFPA